MVVCVAEDKLANEKNHMAVCVAEASATAVAVIVVTVVVAVVVAAAVLVYHCHNLARGYDTVVSLPTRQLNKFVNVK